MGNILDKRAVLDRIKQFYSLKGNAELARLLGVAPNTITNWYARGTFDIDVVYTNCVDIDFNWLFSGSKTIPAKEKSVLPQNTKQDNTGAAEAYYRMYKEKDEENKELLKENARLEERLRLAEKDRSDFKKFVEGVSTKSTLLRTNQDAPSAGAPLKE